jgi:hypothetical protein
MRDEDFRRRLEKLEAQVPRQPTAEEQVRVAVREVLFFAVAQYLGNPTEEESPMDAFARALGYAPGKEFRLARDSRDPDLLERWAKADTKLLATFGVSWEHKWDDIVDALQRMEAGLSEDYKDRLKGCVEDGLRRLRSRLYHKLRDSA